MMFLSSTSNKIKTMASEKSNLYTYYLTIFLLSLAIFYLFQFITAKHPTDFLYIEKCLLCIISSFFNIFVLYHHCTHPPHPKFLILKRRRFVIYTHIISGIIEFIMCWAAFITGSERFATTAALAAILAHVPSAYGQTSIVFGAKALMVTAYVFTISLHLFCALHLYFEPSSVYWLLNMFLVHNVYVWCRVFYFFFRYVGLFKDSLYTISILASGLILLPAVLGVSANLLLFGYVAISILLYFAIVKPNEQDLARYICERTRDLLVNKAVHETWIKERTRLSKINDDDQLTDRQKAKLIFDDLDMNKNGTLDGEEITRLLNEWGAAASFVKRFSRSSKNEGISFEKFYSNIWRLGETHIGRVTEGVRRIGSAKARFVFDYLDIDGSGYIEGIELQKLLLQWGLAEDEVDEYLTEDEDKQFSFEEFYGNMKPIWEFAFDNMTVVHDDEHLLDMRHPHSN